MKKSAKRSIIVSAVLAIIMCVSLAAGATFALFTSESKVNITVSSGKVNVVATPSNLQTYSGENLTGNKDDDVVKLTTELGGTNGTFINGGTAAFNSEDANTLELTNMTPGDKVTFDITVKNDSTVAIQYRTIIMCKEDDGLFDGLEIDFKDGETTPTGTTVTGDDDSPAGEAAEEATEETNKAQDVLGMTVISKWDSLAPYVDFNPNIVHVTIDLPSDKGNEYQNKNCTISYVVEAIQGNAATDMPADTLYLYTAYDMYAFAEAYNSVDEEISSYTTFKLMSDVDLSGKEWTPIGGLKSGPDRVGFEGTFDGNNKVISGLKIGDVGGDDRQGLFEMVKGSSTIKNVKLVGANIKGSNSWNVGGLIGFVQGSDVTVENCSIDETSIIDANHRVGGLIGTIYNLSEGNSNYRLSNLINNATVKAANNEAQIGGIVGQITQYVNKSDGWTGTITVTITDCHNYGKVEGNSYQGFTGGILGTIQAGTLTIDNCTNAVNLKDFVGLFKGSLIGWVAAPSANTVTIKNCTLDNTSIGAVKGNTIYKITVGDAVKEFTSGTVEVTTANKYACVAPNEEWWN